ncbi:MAG TPA: hydantoinase B/oxoprolinase family protein, partial [Planctomycetia bacterium]|nr:hydantoinase B/oxoprolinase family protein [Planctomycetia bacterium]
FNTRYASIAEQMGETLRRTSLSTNVKERLDYSCAIFTSDGALAVNAPHIPVHLGAMGDTVRGLIADVPDMRPGDVYVTNDPYRGGSHLPDVTVISPVFDRTGKRILFFTGSRAHHAEIGGVAPGSMPAFSRSLAEEGVLIRAFRLVSNGVSHEDGLRKLLLEAEYPTRAVEENLADVLAQAAANRTGADLLLELVDKHGEHEVRLYLEHIRAAAAAKSRAALARLPAGTHKFADQLDVGATIQVAVTIAHDEQGGSAIVDFEGTSPALAGNQNANPAIVRAAVMYCFRCLIGEEIPLNDGVLAPVTIVVPEGSLLRPPANADPAKCAAVAGGNVETSQRVVDVVLGALGAAAASQGTMNNFLFGRSPTSGAKGFGYYETIAGGVGAGPGFPGAHAVHSHMTNTRITDPEVLEARYPVRLAQFSVRAGSGGAGDQAGGDGVVREFEFLAPVEVSILSNRRATAPFGLAGGAPGKSGRNLLKRAGSDAWEELAPAVQTAVHAGDIVRLETPGGGGYGEAKPA